MQKDTPPKTPDQPLSMSVHDLPDLIGQGELIERKGSRWVVWVVLLVCAAPVIMSYLTYYVIKPQARSVHGELIEPMRGLPELKAAQEDGALVDLLSLKGQWLLISVDSGACPQACQDRLYLQRQLIVSLGKEQDRVDWVWLIKDQAPIDNVIKPGLAQARVLRVSQAALKTWLLNATEGPASKGGDQLEDYFYLVDPMGQLMERFKAPKDRESTMNIKKDIDKLLKASASWDKAGR
jgi:hypothetical protein